MLNQAWRESWTKVMTPPAKLFLALGISPDVVTVVGTLGVAPGHWPSTPGEFFWGTLVVTLFVFSDTIDGVMARGCRDARPVGGLPGLDPGPGRRRRHLRWAGALVRRPRRDNRCMAGLALACLILGSVVRYAKARAEGLGMTANVGHRRAGRPPGRGAGGHRPVGLGLPEIVLGVVLGLLAVASLVTVVQRMLTVRRQALAAATVRDSPPPRPRSGPARRPRGSGARRRPVAAGFRRLGRGRALPERARTGCSTVIADRRVRARRSGRRSGSEPTAPGSGPSSTPAGAARAVREGMRSYLRYWCDAFRLPELAAATLLDRRCAAPARRAGARAAPAGGSVVCSSATWATGTTPGPGRPLQLAPVTTVAERLRARGRVRRFLAFRGALGMSIVPARPAERRVRRAARRAPATAARSCPAGRPRPHQQRRRRWSFFGEPARMAVGPAALAVATGAALLRRVDPLRAPPRGPGAATAS